MKGGRIYRNDRPTEATGRPEPTAMRIHKVYTRTGDRGKTDLVGGERVPKDSLRIESYGTVDELQAFLGMLRAALAESDGHAEVCRACVEAIHRVQQDLFDLGSTLATPPEHLFPLSPAPRCTRPCSPRFWR